MAPMDSRLITTMAHGTAATWPAAPSQASAE